MGRWEFTLDPVQEWGEEVEDGVVYGVTLHREPVQPQADSDDLGFTQYKTLKIRRLKAASLERLVVELVNPQCNETDYARIFLSTYQAFTGSDTLIKLLFQREDMLANSDTSVCLRSPLPPLIRTWLQEFREGLRDGPQHPALRLLIAHMRQRLCFRRLARQAESLLKTFQDEEKHGHSGNTSVVAEEGCEGAPKEDVHGEEGSMRQDVEEPGSFMTFLVQDIAEELTRLDSDLFVKVVPFHCLGCVWGQRDKKENRCLAPTVRATINQFNAVTNCVITSLLCPTAPAPPSSPTCGSTNPTQRAKIIEKWIAVAQECRQLRNFSSLRAILSALQSNAVYRLKKTWAAVSRENFGIFEQLCEIFPDENCVLTSREILVEEGDQQVDDSVPKSPKLCPLAKHMSSTDGVVPYLGTLLTILTMLDTALTDTVEGGLINFEKRRREFEILSKIRQLQASCAHYTLTSHPNIALWLSSSTLLSDQEGYELSRELEPPIDPCPSSPGSWSHRLIAKKISALRGSNEGTTKKTHADQISVSSSGSSGSEMEDLSSPNLTSLRVKLQSLSGSCQNISEDFAASSSSSSSSSSMSPTSSSSSYSSSQPDLSALSPESAICSPSPCASPSLSAARLAPPQPVYNKQVADSCIIRVSVEFGNNGNMYKSILLTSQDKTAHVVQRALEKHNLEGMCHREFSLTQVLSQDKELLIPDTANVFYAMCTSANYDFVLRQRWRNHRRTICSTSSPGGLRRGRHSK